MALAATLAGGGALWATRGADNAESEPSRTNVPVPGESGADPQLAPGTATTTEKPGARTARGEAGRDTGMGRQKAAADDDPAIRAALEAQADLAAPHWARVAPRIADATDRAAAVAMIERLRTLSEPSAGLAREEYDLTTRLIGAGDWDAATLRELQYLNSTAASVIQGGDPAAIDTPEEARRRDR
jgi:hypothetical protein